MLEIDGATGEGGGQVLRTSLSLSAALGQPFRITNIRAGRSKPGLMRQHLTCIRAAAQISGATVEGDCVGSQHVLFRPGAVRAGSYLFKVGSAGSCLLVLQTVLPPLLRAEGPSEIVLEGGTHNPKAPPWELIERAWIPSIRAMGAGIDGRLERHGFMPAGGGRAVVSITPGAPKPFTAIDRGTISRLVAEALFANLPVQIAERELQMIGARLSLADGDLRLRGVKSSGPGNALVISLEHAAGTEVIAEFGMKSRAAEVVARCAAREAQIFLASRAAVGRHLADQLMVPMALMAGGRFSTVKPSRHTRTNAQIICRFAPDTVKLHRVDRQHEIEIAAIPNWQAQP